MKRVLLNVAAGSIFCAWAGALAACACMHPLFGGTPHPCDRPDLVDRGPPMHDTMSQNLANPDDRAPLFAPRPLTDAGYWTCHGARPYAGSDAACDATDGGH